MLEVVNFFRTNPVALFLLLAWNFYWKGRALWRAARKNQVKWFIAILVINTIGILEIAYLYYFGKLDKNKK